MNGKLYIKKFIRDDGETLSFDAEEIYLSEDNTLLVRSDPATTAVDFTEADGGEMIRQRGAIYHQTVKGLIVPKTSDYWSLCTRLSRFFVFNHTYKIVYVKVNGSMFATNGAWISSGLQIVPVPHENYSYWNIEFAIGNIYWRQYAENGEGEQIYSNSITLPLITASMGGELWDTAELQTLSGEGSAFQIEGTSISATNTNVRLKGDTFQQTYSGAQLLTKNGMATPYTDSDYWSLTAGASNTDLGDGWGRWTQTGTTTWVNVMPQMSAAISGGTYKTSTVYTILFEWKNVSNFDRVTISQPGNAQDPFDGEEATVSISLSQTSGTSKIALTTKSTLTDSMRAVRMFFTKHTTSGDSNIDIRVTIVEGDYSSSDLQWQPYVGGVASPNPDYPQDVQVVTGEQTIEVSDGNDQDRSYTVDLGPFELCKIGDYQDYIYKSGSDWYLHKEIGKITFDSSTGWTKHSTTQGNVFTLASTGLVGYAYNSGQTAPALMDTDRVIELGSMADNAYGVFGITNSGQLRVFRGDYDSSYTVAVFKSEMTGHYVYGALVQPTNTKITDATLVAQLNALASVRAYSGETVYSTSGTPLPVIFHIEMTQSVGEGEVWDNVGGVWEAGSGGVQTISVDSTQKIYPVWTVTGPCVNPVLQNNTTDTFASFDGTVAAGQTLTVYFEDGIAYLDSAIATRYVSGYVSFLPGENMVGFNSDGGSAETSTISWDNIIN